MNAEWQVGGSSPRSPAPRSTSRAFSDDKSVGPDSLAEKNAEILRTN